MPNIVNPLVSGSLEAEIQDLQGSNLPAKYQGKSLEDVVKMHEEAEKALSRQGQTVGEQRKVIDKFLEFQLQDKATKSEVRPALTADVLFADPDTAIKRSIEDSEVSSKVKKVERELSGLNLQIQQQAFESRNPDVKEVVTDPDFQKWVQESPYRMRMAQQLGQYDFNAGEELLHFWKDYQEVQGVRSQKDEAVNKRKQALSNAHTEGQGAATEQSSSRKIFNRVEISNLMIRAQTGDKEAATKYFNPAFQAELREAYADGRVR